MTETVPQIYEVQIFTFLDSSRSRVPYPNNYPVLSHLVLLLSFDLSKILLTFHFHIHHFKLYWHRPGFWLQASKCDDNFFFPICLLSVSLNPFDLYAFSISCSRVYKGPCELCHEAHVLEAGIWCDLQSNCLTSEYFIKLQWSQNIFWFPLL